MALSPRQTSVRRAQRNRTRLKKVGAGRPRLSVFRSSKHIYAQVIDDANGVTLAHATSLESGSDSKKGSAKKGAVKKGSDAEAAAAVGKLVAERAIEKGVKDVVFDRGSYVYHGRVKALADAAREAGLNF
jgi:large subunit ribosomal protein L18